MTAVLGLVLLSENVIKNTSLTAAEYKDLHSVQMPAVDISR